MPDGDQYLFETEPSMQESGIVDRDPMSDRELITFLDENERDSLGYVWGGQLSFERGLAQKYYFAEPYGNEVEGRSQVVSTEVFDTVEWILPSLIRVFASTDKSVEFEGTRQEDVEGAQQATDACNYVYWKQNPGFLNTYTWFKDALMMKNGAVKWYWEKKVETKRERYQGLTVEQLQLYILNKPNIELIGQQARPDPMAMQNPQVAAAIGMGQMQMPMVYDIEIAVTDEFGKVCIVPIPPEELLVSRNQNSLALDDCPYVSHISKKTLSWCRDQGWEFQDSEVTGPAPTNVEMSPEAVERRKLNEDSVVQPISDNSTDPSQRTVWVRETYCLVDFDGDGIAERRRIIRAGDKVMENEYCENVQIAAITPNIIQHRFFGISVAEMVMDLQLLKSTLWRSMVDNLFHTNNQGHIVLASADGRVQANIDDLLNSRPGRIIREYAPGAVRAETVPWVGHQTFPMMEYIDQQLQNRTGSNNLTSGLDADSLNKTARGATLAQNKMQEKIELIARIFAECGMKPLFKGVMLMLSKYQSRPLMFRLRNKFVQYDPREWSTQFDMNINVGLGTGNKDQQLMHLTQILQQQMGIAASPFGPTMIEPKNLYSTLTKIVENAGFKNVEEFYTDPSNKPVQPPPPPPVDPVAVEEVKIKKFDAETDRIKVLGELKLKEGDLKLNARGQDIDMVKQDKEIAEKGKDRKLLQQPAEEAQKQTGVMEQQAGEMGGLREAFQAIVGKLQEHDQALSAIFQKASAPRKKKGSFNGKPFELTEE